MSTAPSQAPDVKIDDATDGALAAAGVEAEVSTQAIIAASTAQAKIDAAVAEAAIAPKTAKVPVGKRRPRKSAVTATAPSRRGQQGPTAGASATPANPLTNTKDPTMENAQTHDATGAQAAAADVQTSAKAAFEKLRNYAGEVTEFTKGNVEALVESGRILGAGVQDIARGEVEAAKGAFETLTADLKAMAAVKSPTELFKLQGEIARRNFDALVARTSKNAEVGMKLANDAFAPISTRMSLAAERFSNAA